MKVHTLVGLSFISSTAALNCSTTTFQSIFNSNNVPATVKYTSQLGNNSTFKVTGNLAYPESPTGLQPLCAVEVVAFTEVGTNYTFGLFLPDTWNNRFLAVGNGGYAGGVNWIDMGNGVGYGFAVMSTDTGHNSSFQTTSWAYGNPESITDWGWRAMHGSTVNAKILTEAYYGSAPEYSYFSGCSVGGRQGLKALELFPDDYNGVTAGAPAWWTTRIQLFALKATTYNAPAGSAHSIPESMFTVISEEVIKQCDGQDGLNDTIISDPFGCNFNPDTLLCQGNSTSQCLSAPQIDTLNKIHSDWIDVNQTFVFNHFLLGSEATWSQNIGDGSGQANQLGYVQDLLQVGPDFAWEDLDYDTVLLSESINPGNASADYYDISPFYQAGGKLLHYHGLADSTCPTGTSLYWYSHVLRALAPKSIDVSSFYRLFLIPGMEHCQSTPSGQNAPWYISGANQAAVLGSDISGVPGFRDAKHDVLLALMAWVENGTAPNEIIATKWIDDDVTQALDRQRPICAYPNQTKYNGTGNPDLAESWTCELLY
ncbi:hypothetical protein ACHAO1_011308 [Botrytis cinerea]